jgi:TIR domain
MIPGTSWADEIEQELGRCRAVVVLWSASAVRSNWVKNEANVGLRRDILLPVFVDEAKPPLAFQHIEGAHLRQWRDVVRDPEFRLLCEGVARLIAPARGTVAGEPARSVQTVDASSQPPALTVTPHGPLEAAPAYRTGYQRLLLFYAPTSGLAVLLAVGFYLALVLLVAVPFAIAESGDTSWTEIVIGCAVWALIVVTFWWCARLVDQHRGHHTPRGVVQGTALLYWPRSRAGRILHTAFYTLFVIMTITLAAEAATDTSFVSDPDFPGLLATALLFGLFTVLVRAVARRLDS